MARSSFPSELKSFVTIATGPRSLAVNGVKVNCFCAVKGAVLESVTATVKVKLVHAGLATGAPVLAAVIAIKPRPDGSVPVASVQVIAPVPPVDRNAAV